MRVLVLTFSPAGGTSKVSRKLEDKLVGKGHKVQHLNITGNREIFKKGNIVGELEKQVEPHDVICIGSPVYEKHIEMYVKNVYEQLPMPNEKWGKLAVPFFTYGGISSGIALRDAEEILSRRGRTVIAAMKIEASHIVLHKLETRVNEGMPGEEMNPVIDDLIERISNGADQDLSSLKKELNYQKGKERFVCAIMKESMLHKKLYGNLIVEEAKCVGCGTCIEKCPIQRIELKNEKAFMTGTMPGCIHCFSCVRTCPTGAITYDNDEEGWAKIERIYGKVAREGSAFRSEEEIRSAVYPIIRR
jgi:ferredoxin/NAD(P)H-dependent FMN reductase